MAESVDSNVDLLSWFDEGERKACSHCGERACVSLPAALSSFCLACGAVSINGKHLDTDRRFAA